MTISDVQVALIESGPLAVVRRQARASELSRVVPEGCWLVWSFIRGQKLKGGRHVAIYWDGAIHLDVGVQLDGSFAEGGEVVRSATPAGPAAFVTHLGPYGQLGAAHKAIRDWCSAHNR